jgi:hypothetical protein
METNTIDELYEYIIQTEPKTKKKRKCKDNFLSPDESNTVKFEDTNDDSSNTEDNDLEVEKFKLFLSSQNEKSLCKIKPCITPEWLSYIKNLNKNIM